ncbi:MAG: group 1 truncated hemoglobin [Bryobacteraceae bacterium]|mgnify:CR=1 FL=1|nr:group 1 truncated hemoglobin [Bryobacteraceae bacterium]
MEPTSSQSLYEQLGGEPAVDAAVDVFYRKVLSDDRVSRFFDDVDMDRQIAKQKSFLTMVFGGPVAYTGKDMRAGHAHLVERGLDDSHVDAVIELLGQSLREVGAPEHLIAKVAGIAESARADVLNR